MSGIPVASMKVLSVRTGFALAESNAIEFVEAARHPGVLVKFLRNQVGTDIARTAFIMRDPETNGLPN
jgi:hypothetical protein